VNSFLSLCVADIWACYKEWATRALFSYRTARQSRLGCYMRDADGYLIEVGQYTQRSLDRFKNEAS
jgi:alpha-D-ribose 1-methylphosphonate 5-triphosphate synthase subunit PhnI